MIQVASADQEAMIAMLNDTPPITMLISGTEDQRREIWRVRERHIFLKQKLTAYFSGKADLSIEGLSQFDQDSLGLERDKLLAFYALIQGSWAELIQLSESAGIFFSAANIHQPGEMVAAFIEASAADRVAQYTSPFFRWTPSASRKQLKAMRDAMKLLEENDYSELRTPEKRKIDKLTAEIEREAHKSHSQIPFSFVMKCCHHIAQKSGKHSAIRRHLEAYNDVCARAMKHLNSELHPRKGRKGFEIVKGQKKIMGTSGGVASA